MPAPLPDSIHETLQTYGVLAPAKPPKFDALLKALADRDGRINSFTWSREGGAAINVGLQGNGFDAVNDEPSLAFAEAFAQALEAAPRQLGFDDGE